MSLTQLLGRAPSSLGIKQRRPLLNLLQDLGADIDPEPLLNWLKTYSCVCDAEGKLTRGSKEKARGRRCGRLHQHKIPDAD